MTPIFFGYIRTLFLLLTFILAGPVCLSAALAQADPLAADSSTQLGNINRQENYPLLRVGLVDHSAPFAYLDAQGHPLDD